MHPALLYISLPPLQDYDVKIPNFTFCGTQDNDFLYLFLNFRKVFSNSAPPLNMPTSDELNQIGISAIKFEGSSNSLFKWRLSSRRRRCCLSALLSKDKHRCLQGRWLPVKDSIYVFTIAIHNCLITVRVSSCKSLIISVSISALSNRNKFWEQNWPGIPSLVLDLLIVIKSKDRQWFTPWKTLPSCWTTGARWLCYEGVR